MRFFKGLIIIYFVWAVGYSVIVIPPWVDGAVRFKLSGGAEIISTFQDEGFVFDNPHVDNVGTTLTLIFFVHRDQTNYVLRFLAGPHVRQMRKEHTSVDTISGGGRSWAINLTPRGSVGKSAHAHAKKTVAQIEIDPNNLQWRPLTEFHLLVRSIPIFDAANSGLLHFPPIGVPVVLLIYSTYPVYYSLSVFYAALIAFSPPAIVSYTVFLPPLAFVALIAARLNTRRLLKTKNP